MMGTAWMQIRFMFKRQDFSCKKHIRMEYSSVALRFPWQCILTGTAILVSISVWHENQKWFCCVR